MSLKLKASVDSFVEMLIKTDSEGNWSAEKTLQPYSSIDSVVWKSATNKNPQDPCDFYRWILPDVLINK